MVPAWERSVSEHHWFYVREGRREGPVRRARLLELVRGGWLAPDDLVWTEGMPEWVPAGTVDWLFGGRVARAVHGMLDAATHAPPRRPAAVRRRAVLVDWDRVEIRHLVAVAGGLLAALGAAFLLIASSPLAWWLLGGGTVLLAAGLHVELVPWIVRLAAAVGRRLAPAMGGVEGPARPQRRRQRDDGGVRHGRVDGQRRRRRRGRRDDDRPRGDHGGSGDAPRRRRSRRRRDRGDARRRSDGGSQGP